MQIVQTLQKHFKHSCRIYCIHCVQFADTVNGICSISDIRNKYMRIKHVFFWIIASASLMLHRNVTVSNHTSENYFSCYLLQHFENFELHISICQVAYLT